MASSARRAPRLAPGVQAVRRPARRRITGLCLERGLLADEPRRRRERGGHGGAATGRRLRWSEPIAFLVPLRSRAAPLVPRSRPSLGEADEPNGARRVPGTARFVVPERAVLNRRGRAPYPGSVERACVSPWEYSERPDGRGWFRVSPMATGQKPAPAPIGKWARLVSNQRPLACEAVVPQARTGVLLRSGCASMRADVALTGTRTALVPNRVVARRQAPCPGDGLHRCAPRDRQVSRIELHSSPATSPPGRYARPAGAASSGAGARASAAARRRPRTRPAS